MFFFFNDTATTEIYTLSLHDALPISSSRRFSSNTTSPGSRPDRRTRPYLTRPSNSPTTRSSSQAKSARPDRKSTRLNSSHANISYAVFCLKKNIDRIVLERRHVLVEE